MVRNDHDAEDIVQESFLKALGAIHTLRAGDARPWLLSIVRNTALNFLNRQKPAQASGRYVAADIPQAAPWAVPKPFSEIV